MHQCVECKASLLCNTEADTQLLIAACFDMAMRDRAFAATNIHQL